MKLRDLVEEVTPEQMRQRQYYDGYDAGAIDVRSGRPDRFQGRLPRTEFERGYAAGYRQLKIEKPKHTELPAAA